MNEQDKKRISKFLSFILRHSPEAIALQLDDHGWANVEELLQKAALHQRVFSKEDLIEIVATNDKKRYAFDETRTRIRASQGHSLQIELQLPPAVPPEILYHGTAARFLENIKVEGLMKMSRQHVHLSASRKTAESVGRRRGIPVILCIQSGRMHRDGAVFFLSDNDVWLVEHVDVKYIEL